MFEVLRLLDEEEFLPQPPREMLPLSPTFGLGRDQAAGVLFRRSLRDAAPAAGAGVGPQRVASASPGLFSNMPAALQTTLQGGRPASRSLAIKITARGGGLLQSDVSVDSGVASTSSARGRARARRGGDEEGSEAMSDLDAPSEQG